MLLFFPFFFFLFGRLEFSDFVCRVSFLELVHAYVAKNRTFLASKYVKDTNSQSAR